MIYTLELDDAEMRLLMLAVAGQSGTEALRIKHTNVEALRRERERRLDALLAMTMKLQDIVGDDD